MDIAIVYRSPSAHQTHTRKALWTAHPWATLAGAHFQQTGRPLPELRLSTVGASRPSRLILHQARVLIPSHPAGVAPGEDA